jgi:hypothetical protein
MSVLAVPAVQLARAAAAAARAACLATESDVARPRALPGVADVGAMSRLLLPTTNDSAKRLRAAAAQLRGDVLLV